MTHLSELAVDQVASGLAPAEATVADHLATCPACRARVAERGAEAVAIRALPGFHQGLDRLARNRPEPARPARRWAWLALPAAAALATIVLWRPTPPPPAADRLKGAAAVGLVDASGRAVPERLPVGAVVHLAVDAHGHRNGLVLGIDAGRVVQLWPATGDAAPLPPGVRPAFEVTPGSLILLAFFGDGAISTEEARRAVEAAVAECAGRADPECINPARLGGESTRARAYYRAGSE